MGWLILCIICIISAAIALVVWQRWIAPWPQIDQLVGQIVHGEEPRTFLVNGGIQAQRVGLALENIFRRQQQLAEQIAGRESGTQTILGVMQDGLLVVDSRRRVALSNPAFEKMFELRDGSLGAPLLEVVRHATADGESGKARRRFKRDHPSASSLAVKRTFLSSSRRSGQRSISCGR